MKEYINREAAIQGILNDSCELVFYTKENVIDYLESIPASDVAPARHGRWILVDKNGTGVCSECNRQDHIDPLATHCRYCGALMDEKL